MTALPRIRRHTDGRVALCRDGMWLTTSIPGVTKYPSWRTDDRDCSGDGWSELFVAELPEPDGWADCVGNDGEDTKTPYWETGYNGSITAWTEGVETPEWGLEEDLDQVRSDALRMLAAVAACERYRADREATR